MEQQSGSTSLPDNWEQIFEEMTQDMVINVTRKYKDVSNANLADLINNVKAQLRVRSEMIQPRTPEGVALHAELEELDEELRIRDF